MRQSLQISLGQCTNKGIKEVNQDFIGAYFPAEPLLSSKGVVVAISDGISSSNVSQVASETAIGSFINDYYCTSEAQSVKRSAEVVLKATNSWLYSQTQNSPYRFDRDKGYICTFSALVVKSNTAHVFHCGDTRVYRVFPDRLEQVTHDHVRHVDENTRYLTRALGIHPSLDVDYQAITIAPGDCFLLASDGVFDFVPDEELCAWVAQEGTKTADKSGQKAGEKGNSALDDEAQAIVDAALKAGSDDNVSVQLVRIDALPEQQIDEVYHQISTLPLPPKLAARTMLDHYVIERDLYISSRSHVFLAKDTLTEKYVVIKTPSVEMQDSTAYLERFLLEDWIARRVNSPYVLKAILETKKRGYLYLTTEYIEGQTLAQWRRDNPLPEVETVRVLVEQIAKGLQAFHRQEMVHQDIRPNNIMLDKLGTVKIIDFGSTKVPGINELKPLEQAADDALEILGTQQYAAPEYFLGQGGDSRSDLYSLGVLAYYLLCGKLPYGPHVANARTRADQHRLVYTPISQYRKDVPDWVDDAIRKAVKVKPLERYQALSEFTYDLRHPNPQFLNRTKPPLIERNPVAFWQGVSGVLVLIVFYLLYYINTLF